MSYFTVWWGTAEQHIKFQSMYLHCPFRDYQIKVYCPCLPMSSFATCWIYSAWSCTPCRRNLLLTTVLHFLLWTGFTTNFTTPIKPAKALRYTYSFTNVIASPTTQDLTTSLMLRSIFLLALSSCCPNDTKWFNCVTVARRRSKPHQGSRLFWFNIFVVLQNQRYRHFSWSRSFGYCLDLNVRFSVRVYSFQLSANLSKQRHPRPARCRGAWSWSTEAFALLIQVILYYLQKVF